MSHLGDRIAALVDGEMGHEARDRTLAHLAVCRECRAEADAERQAKNMLAGLGGPEPSADLVHRLRTLAEPGPPLPPNRPSFPGTVRPPTLAAPTRRPAGIPAESRRPGGRPHRRLRFVTVGALSGFAIVMGTAFAAGGTPEERGTPLTPPVDRYRVEHAATTGEVPFVDPAFATFGGSFQPAFATFSPTPLYYPSLTGASVSGVPSR
jgi:anti-sigma factor RsiW